MRAIEQDQPCDVPGRRRGINGARKAVPDEPRQITAVVQMGVGEDDCIDGSRLNREGCPVELAKLAKSLKEAAVDQQALAVPVDEMA